MFSGLFDIYHNRHLDPDIGPRQLQKKVQFDIRFYFARRGAENMHKMTKTTFAVKLDKQTGIKYVIRAEYEATKNHKANENDIVTGYMPSMVDKKYCPVRSFIMYTEALHPTSESLWQTLKSNLFPTDGQKVWYGPGNVGHNSLDSFMTKLAKSCGFQQKHYTNHSLRASGITTLKRNNYNDKQIMSITGHRSSASLAIYKKVASDEKLRMGCTLGYALTGDPSCLTKQDEISTLHQQHPRETNYQPSSRTPNSPLQEIDVISRAERRMPQYKRQNPCQGNTVPTKRRPNQSSATIVAPQQVCHSSDPIFFEDDMDDQDLLAAVSQFENQTTSENSDLVQMSSQTTSTYNNNQFLSRQVVKKTFPSIPTFTNCKIEGGITINICKS